MARIRSVHPGLFTDEIFMALSPMARLFWIGLWTEADDHGVFTWKPIVLRARLLPVDAVDPIQLLAEIEAAGAILRFDEGGSSYGVVRNFIRYQRPKKPAYVHPFPESVRNFAGLKQEEIPASSPPVPGQFPSSTEKSPQMEEEGGRGEKDVKKESEKVARAPRPPRVDLLFWELDEKGKQIILDERLDPKSLMATVRDWAANAEPQSKRFKRDPHAFLRNWCRRQGSDRPTRAPPPRIQPLGVGG